MLAGSTLLPEAETVVTVVAVDMAAPEAPAEMAAREEPEPVVVARVTSATGATVVPQARAVQAEMVARAATVLMAVPQVQ